MAEDGHALSAGVAEFLESNCYDCHHDEEPEAGLDLTALSLDLATAGATERWVRIFDRVRASEMPPPDYSAVANDEKAAFLDTLGSSIRRHQAAEQDQRGRVRSRRLTRKQVERSLQDVLGIDTPLAEYLPEESRQGRYSTVADGQAMSHFQMQAHLGVVDRALEEAFRRAFTAEDIYERDLLPRGIARKNPKRRCREPEMRDGKAVVWNGGVAFYGRIPATTAPEDGWYRFGLEVSALKPPKLGGVWSTVRSGLCVSSAPLLEHVTAFEATEQKKTIEFETWLPKGHMLEVRPADATLKRGRFAGGQIGTGEGEPQNIPGIAFSRLTMQRVHKGATDDGVRQRLFGPLQRKGDQLLSEDPAGDVAHLMAEFAERAFRRPVEVPSIATYVRAAQDRLRRGDTLRDVLRFGYRALLCSPRFLYFTEQPGPLDAHAVASRLSYFLTGRAPDATLRSLADSGQLLQRATQANEVERLLEQYRSTFVSDFAAEWLDLEKLNATVPDRKLHPDFDPVVSASMRDETHAYLERVLAENLSVVRLIDGDFTFLNSRLARYYGIDGVHGDRLQHVALTSDHSRGGLLTHGSILRITANGTNTSPVLRGVWVCERLLGVPIPPPPENVPAIEPDVRGATTIREQLERHRSDDACAACHRKLDPAGFALENFDAAGRWRDFYPKARGKAGRRKVKIDPSYQLADGQVFADIREFRTMAARDARQLAAGVVENLLVYGTGGPITFADRRTVETIVDEVEAADYGFQSIVQAVAASPIFLNK